MIECEGEEKRGRGGFGTDSEEKEGKGTREKKWGRKRGKEGT